jgi:hypothetical protein
MGLLFADDFADLSHWSAGSFSISGTTAYHGGDGSGGGGATHAQEAGTAYVEALAWGDATGGDNWAVVKMDNNGGAAYDGNGAGIAFRSTGGEVFLLSGGSPSLVSAASGWPSYVLPTPPRSLATAVHLGISRVGTGLYDFYVNRGWVARYSGITAAGANLFMAAYNGMGGHFEYVASASRPLTIFDDVRASSPMVLG